MNFDAPFYVGDDDDGLIVWAPVFGAPGDEVGILECATEAVADEMAHAFNLVWQTYVYGVPDPALKATFNQRYNDLGYCDEDIMYIIEKMAECGVLPSDAAFTVHSVH